MQWILLSRRGCHLCEYAEQLLAKEGILVQRLEIDHFPDFLSQYSFRVPVLLSGEKVLLEGEFSQGKINQLKLDGESQ